MSDDGAVERMNENRVSAQAIDILIGEMRCIRWFAARVERIYPKK
jgi:hypothetical protein